MRRGCKIKIKYTWPTIKEEADANILDNPDRFNLIYLSDEVTPAQMDKLKEYLNKRGYSTLWTPGRLCGYACWKKETE
jgi:hypothetical protein